MPVYKVIDVVNDFLVGLFLLLSILCLYSFVSLKAS